jgi:6-phosphogluconolactonase (cycloisomerase 2 family)
VSDPAERAHELAQIQFLEWIARNRRSYAAVQEAWRSTCPRLSIWEDALGAGLVECEQATGKPAMDCAVTLSDKGRSLLQAHIKLEENRRAVAAD